MSSHHIVKENQEPALIVASLEALDSEYIGQLLEWSPTVFTDDYTIDFLLATDIKVDFVVTAGGSDYGQEQIQHLPLQTDLITDALHHLITHRYKAVNIICDEVPVAVYDFCGAINIVLYIDGKRFVLVKGRYEKWKQKGEKLFIREDKLKSLVGIQKVAHHEFVTEQDGFIYLEFNNQEFVLVGEEI